MPDRARTLLDSFERARETFPTPRMVEPGRRAHVEALKDIANNGIGANPGNMSVFNSAWNAMGTEAAAERVRETIHYLLHGPAQVPREDRLTELIEDRNRRYMQGFREALLTRVLCIMHPGEFLPILNYDGVGTGKRHIAEAVYGLRLPPRDRSTMQIGRLIHWSNGLLRDLVGDGFESMQHASAFLWWAKDQPKARVDRNHGI